VTPRSAALKRAIDVVGAGTGLLLAAVPMAAIAVAVRRTLGRPVLFRQQRPGLHARPFELLKFRTMREGIDAAGGPLDDAARLTPLGQRLRAWSLDELPELVNVLRGDMSLVGPRPLLMEYLDLYTPEQARRHEVRPGLTGLAQVAGRNALSWQDRFALDVWYVDHWSLWLDARILARTVWAVLRRRGITDGTATAERFTGS
jgi:sugar transferase EpsL